MRRIALWVAGIAAGPVAVALIGAAMAVATFDINRLVAPAQARVKTSTGCDLVISGGAHLDFSLPPKLIVNAVSFGNAPWAGASPLAAAKQVAVQFELLPLLQGRFNVTRLELVAPDRRGRSFVHRLLVV